MRERYSVLEQKESIPLILFTVPDRGVECGNAEGAEEADLSIDHVLLS